MSFRDQGEVTGAKPVETAGRGLMRQASASMQRQRLRGDLVAIIQEISRTRARGASLPLYTCVQTVVTDSCTLHSLHGGDLVLFDTHHTSL